MEDDNSSINKLLIIIGITSIALLIIFNPINSTMGNEIKEIKGHIEVNEPLKTIETTGQNSPSCIRMNSTLIIVKGAKCSCGSNHNNYNRHGTVKFENYCPYCKKYGVLVYNLKGYISDGEFSCKLCGFDACVVDGNDKSGNFKKVLIKIID